MSAMLWTVGAWCCGVDVPSPSDPLSASCQRWHDNLCDQMGCSINGNTTKWMVYKGKSHWNGWWNRVPLFEETPIYEVVWSVRNEESGPLTLRFGFAFFAAFPEILRAPRTSTGQGMSTVFPMGMVTMSSPHLQTSRENSSLLSNKPRLTWQWILKKIQKYTKVIYAMAVTCTLNILATSAKVPVWWSPKIHFHWAKAAALVQSSLLPGKK